LLIDVHQDQQQKATASVWKYRGMLFKRNCSLKLLIIINQSKKKARD